MRQQIRTTAIILAAGTGSRTKLGYNKILFSIGVPMVIYTITAFERSSNIDTIVIVTAKEERDVILTLIKQAGFTKVSSVICGGITRQESSRLGVESIDDADIIAIHDAARPFVTEKTIAATIVAAQTHGASIAAIPIQDTVKIVKGKGIIEETLDRHRLYSAQTPQTFQSSIIRTAHARALSDRYEGTDDASLVERLGTPVVIVPGTQENIKITTPDDLIYAQMYFKNMKETFSRTQTP